MIDKVIGGVSAIVYGVFVVVVLAVSLLGILWGLDAVEAWTKGQPRTFLPSIERLLVESKLLRPRPPKALTEHEPWPRRLARILPAGGDDDSQALAHAGRAAWLAMLCAHFTNAIGIQPEEKAEREKEAARLMRYGYTQGQRFFIGVFADKVKPEDIKQIVPFFMLWGLRGPSAEFLLGRVVERAEEDAYSSITARINDTADRLTGKPAPPSATRDPFLRRAGALEEYDRLKCRSWAERAR
jgi:hypothetical protein